jgi:hypothetical protein
MWYLARLDFVVINSAFSFSNLVLKIMATSKPAGNSKRKEIEGKKKVKRKARREKQAASLRERRRKKREAKKEATPKE